jgi:hypothetical protein
VTAVIFRTVADEITLVVQVFEAYLLVMIT